MDKKIKLIVRPINNISDRDETQVIVKIVGLLDGLSNLEIKRILDRVQIQADLIPLSFQSHSE